MLMNVELSDVMVARNFGTCSMIKLASAVEAMPANQNRTAFNPIDSSKVGIKVNANVSTAAIKQVNVPSGFRPIRFTNNPAVMPPRLRGYCR